MNQEQTIHNLEDKIDQFNMEKINYENELETKKIENDGLANQIKRLTEES